MRRVVVTGMGVISPVGNSVDEFWSSLKAGKSGIARVTKFDPSELKTQIAGEVKNFNPEGILDSKDIRRIDLFSQYGVCAAHEAIKSSGLSLEDEDPFDIGVIVGSGIGGINVLETQLEVFRNKGPKRVSPFYITGMITDIVAGHIAGKFGLNGPNYVTVSACASGAHAIGSAYHTIARGDAEVIVTGGAEGAVSAPSFAGFINIQALSRRNDEPEKASRPFNIDRDGFIMSEGSGMMILEELEHARRRGAEIIAEVAGVGFTADAHHITAPHPEGVGAARAMTIPTLPHSTPNSRATSGITFASGTAGERIPTVIAAITSAIKAFRRSRRIRITMTAIAMSRMRTGGIGESISKSQAT